MAVKGKYFLLIKPVLDYTLAVFLLVCLFPVWAMVACLLYLLQGNDVLFGHDRPGLQGRIFTLYKFRTMDSEGQITPIGKVLRQSSLDELPQILNVLRGEMSFVGPRPLLIEYLMRYTKKQHQRHLVKPGVTGWAQVHGRNRLTLEEKINYDLYYVGHVSFWLDIKILLLTAKKLFVWNEADYHRINPDSDD